MNKAILAVSVVGVLTYCVPTIQAGAVCTGNQPTAYSDDVQPRTAGLICSYNLAVSNSNGMLRMNVRTSSNDIMKSIGISNIKVQYSSDGINWSTEKTLSDMLKSSSSEYILNNYDISVKGGYYYRVTCNHYAKESGLFGSSQSLSNTSNSVWIG